MLTHDLPRVLADRTSRCPSLWRLVSALTVVCTFALAVTADCECGYATTIGNADNGVPTEYIFTDLIETNFARIDGGNLHRNTDWQRQAFNMTRDRARGEFGEMFAVDNVVARPYSQASDGKSVQDAGLRLVVGQEQVDGMVPVAEIDTARTDVLYGTYRAGLKLTGVSGTCAAFFWYFNDTQEIDMEFLSKDFDPTNNSFPVNLVLQSRAAAAAGYDAQKAGGGGGGFVRAHLPFDPTAGFHEYRIDMLRGRVRFYADSALLAEMADDNGDDDDDGDDDGSSDGTAGRPGGHLILQHWSNGNALWSGGPPEREAVMEVAYVKAYFNSSAERRQEDWRRRCGGAQQKQQQEEAAAAAAAAAAVCRIPEVGAAAGGGDAGAREFFFSERPGMVPNQTVYRASAGAKSRPTMGWMDWAGVVAGMVVCAWAVDGFTQLVLTEWFMGLVILSVVFVLALSVCVGY